MSVAQWRSQVKGPQSFAASYAKQGNEKNVETNVALALQRLGDPRWDALRSTDEGKAFVAEIEAWAVQTRHEVKVAAAQQAAQSGLRALESQFRFYEGYVRQKNERSIASSKETCTKLIEQHAAAFGAGDDALKAKVANIASQLGVVLTFTASGADPSASAASASAPAAAASGGNNPGPSPNVASPPSNNAPQATAAPSSQPAAQLMQRQKKLASDCAAVVEAVARTPPFSAIPRATLEGWSHAFQQYDKDASGDIDSQELTYMLEKIGMSARVLEVRALMAEFDQDKSGTIDFQEFLALCAKRNLSIGARSGTAASGPASATPAAASTPTTSTPAARFALGSPGAFDKAVFEPLDKKIRGDLRWMKSHSDLSRVKQYMETITADVSTNLPLLQAEGKLLAELNEAFAEADAKFAKDALDSAKRGVEREKRWVETHLQRGAQSDVLKSRDALVKAVETNREVLLKSAEGQAFLQEISFYLLDVGVRFEALKLNQEADALVRRATSDMRWVTTHLSRKDTSSASRAWERLQEVAAPLLPSPVGPSKFAGLAVVEKFLPEYTALESRVDAEIRSIVVDAEVDALCRRADSEQRWTETFLGQGDTSRVMQRVEDLRGLAETLSSYIGHPAATEKSAAVSQFVQTAHARLQPILEKQEVEAITRPSGQTLYWLKDALRQKNEDKCILLREQLVDRVAPLRERYSAQQDAVKFLAEVDALLSEMEAQLGKIIAEKDSLRLLHVAESAYRWLETSIANKDVRRAQLYLEQLGPAIPPLAQYQEQFSNVREFLTKAAALQDRVDKELGALLADAEIDSMSRRIKTPLSFFQSALASRDPESIVPRRQRLIEAAMPLRGSRHAKAPAAAAALAEVDAALAACDRDMATILGDAAVKRVGAKVRSALSWARSAAERNDNRGALINLQEAHKAVQPLRVEYPTHAGALALVSEADSATQALGAAIGDAITSSEGTNLLEKAAAPLAQAEQSQQRGDLVAATALLRQANATAAPLRIRFGFRPDVQQFLSKLDTLNVSLLGGVPQEEDSAPSIEIDWRLPVAVQDAAKLISREFAEYNELINEWTRECETTIDVEGTKRPPADWWLERCNAACDRASGIVRRVQEQGLPALSTVAPEHPAIPLVQEALPRLAKKAAALRAFAGPMLNYHTVMHDFREGWNSPLREYASSYPLAKRGDRKDEATLWGKCIDSLKAAIAKLPLLAAAAASLPEGYDNTPGEMLATTLEGQLIEAEAQFRLACLKWHKQAAQASDLWEMNALKKQLAERYAGCDEEKSLLALHTRVETVLAEEAAKAAEARRLAEEARARERAEQLAAIEAEWVKPYSCESSAVPTEYASGEAVPEKWEWHADGTLQDTNDSGATYKWTSTTSTLKLTHGKGAAERGFVIFTPSSGTFVFKSEFKGTTKVWLKYDYDATSKTFNALGDSMPSWSYNASSGKLVAGGSSVAKGMFAACEWSCKNIPPPVALFIAVCRDFVAKKIPAWVKAKEKEAEEAAARGGSKRCNGWPANKPAWICSSCAFGSGADSCGVCGGWPSKKGLGHVCSSHDFGSMSSNCKKCGRWEPNESSRVAFPLCNSCSFGSAKDSCCATV